MSTEETVTLKSGSKVQIPKPTSKQRKNQRAEYDSGSSSSDDEKPKNVVEAAKKVAQVFGGDPKQTEMELLSKLLGRSPRTAPLAEVIAGMKVTKEAPVSKRADYVRDSRPQYQQRNQRDHRDQRDPQQQQHQQQQQQRPARRILDARHTVVSVDLFGTEPLGIFTDPSKLQSKDFLGTWKKLEERELRMAVAHPPSNYFEKMAQWTNEGKLWKFPIDNEQDIGEEAEVDFTEHVFLEELLEPWCPQKGPVRHFMELVTVGLSKNPYMTVQEKHDHINYFKNYFEEKKELLKQIIIETKVAKAEQKRVE